MANLLHADLPSSDEEDDDYRPELDKTAENEDRADLQAKKEAKAVRDKRARRGGAAAAGPSGDDDQGEDEGDEADDAEDDDPRSHAKRARIDHLWQLLNSRPGARGEPQQPQQTANAEASKPPAAKQLQAGKARDVAGQGPLTPALSALASGRPPSSGMSLAALCRKAPTKKTDTDILWMKALGVAPKGRQQATSAASTATSQQQQQAAAPAAPEGGAAAAPAPAAAPHGDAAAAEAGSSAAAGANGAGSSTPAAATANEEARAAAAAALAAAREAASLGAARSYNKVTVTETRRFAGKDIQVSLKVDKDSKEAAAAQAAAAGGGRAAASGLDAFLAEVTKKKKVNVFDKSKMDWQDFKSSDNALEAELEAYKKSGNKYLDKVDFLKRTELREYEAERDKRLAADVRTRGRL